MLLLIGWFHDLVHSCCYGVQKLCKSLDAKIKGFGFESIQSVHVHVGYLDFSDFNIIWSECFSHITCKCIGQSVSPLYAKFKIAFLQNPSLLYGWLLEPAR